MPEGGGVCVLIDHILLFSFPTRKGPPPGVHADMPSPETGFLDNRMEPWVEGVVYIRARPGNMICGEAWGLVKVPPSRGPGFAIRRRRSVISGCKPGI